MLKTPNGVTMAIKTGGGYVSTGDEGLQITVGKVVAAWRLR